MHRIRHATLRRRLSGLALVALTPTLARRLKALLTAARQLAGGDFTARARLPQGDDEVGELAHALDALAGELERLAAEVERQRGALLQQEKLATMGSLLAGVVHELNNPLTAVAGQTALLRAEIGDGRSAERVEQIARAAEQCLRTVRNVLALARQRPPERAPVDLNRIVHACLDLLTPQIHHAAVAVALDLGDELPRLWADAHQLQQVAINLVVNALHALRQQPRPRRLSLATRARSPEGPVTLEVTDTGSGIADEVLPRVFEPFFTTKPPGQGTGLGLSLCRRVVEAHGG
jgi:signal transduction histidine kinase